MVCVELILDSGAPPGSSLFPWSWEDTGLEQSRPNSSQPLTVRACSAWGPALTWRLPPPAPPAVSSRPRRPAGGWVLLSRLIWEVARCSFHSWDSCESVDFTFSVNFYKFET